MKNLRKLIPAVAMLVLSAVLMSTASFAWFSMNTEVTATGMQISAVSDAAALVIHEGAVFDKTVTTTTVTSTAAAITLKPVAVKSDVTLATENIEKGATWYYSYSNSTGSSASNGTNGAITDTDLMGSGKYLGKESFMVGLNANSGANETSANLKLKSVTLPASTGISAIIVCNGKIHHATSSSTDVNLDLGIKGTQDGVQILVYYYINGNDTNVTTDNITQLTGQVSFVIGY